MGGDAGSENDQIGAFRGHVSPPLLPLGTNRLFAVEQQDHCAIAKLESCNVLFEHRPFPQ